MLSKETKDQLDQFADAIENKMHRVIDQREVNAQKNIAPNRSNKSFQYDLKKAIKENKGNRNEYIVKANDLFLGDSTNDMFAPQFTTRIFNKPFETDLRAYFPQASTDSESIVVNRAEYQTNSAAVIASEGTQFPLSKNTTSATTFNLDRLAHRFAVSEEFLDSVQGASQFITNQIQGGLIEKLNDNIITDIKANDTAFVTGSGGLFYQAIDNAQEHDVLMVAVNDLRVAKYNPDVIILNPTDFAKISLLKDSNNNYLKGSLFESVRNTLDGVRIIQNPAITSGEFHVLDSTAYGTYYNKVSLEVKVGFDGNDFSSGTRTVVASHRGVLAVYDSAACITGTFSTAKTALETA